MNPKNQVLRRQYRKHLQDKGFDVKTIDPAMRHLTEFEEFTGEKDFSTLTQTVVAEFKRHLNERQSKTGTSSLSASSIVHTLLDLKAFFNWLSLIKGQKVDKEAVAYLSPSRSLMAKAKTIPDRAVPSPENIQQMLAATAATTVVDRRNRALIAFIYLTGMRDKAVVTLRLKHVQLDARRINQDARDVKTKGSKHMLTSWFPVGDDIEQIVIAWVKERLENGAGPEAPLFQATPRYQFAETNNRVKETGWKTTKPVCAVFSTACKDAGIEAFSPHSVRSTLMRLGLEKCATWEELKAWSQNLGHERLDTSMIHYGKLDTDRQDELMQGLVRKDVTVHEEQDLLIKYRALPPDKRTAVRVIMRTN